MTFITETEFAEETTLPTLKQRVEALEAKLEDTDLNARRCIQQLIEIVTTMSAGYQALTAGYQELEKDVAKLNAS